MGEEGGGSWLFVKSGGLALYFSAELQSSSSDPLLKNSGLMVFLANITKVYKIGTRTSHCHISA